MNANDAMKQDRRGFLQVAGAAFALGGWPVAAGAASDAIAKMKIGIIGSGRIGGTLGELWVKAG